MEKEIIRGNNHITKALDEAGVPLSGVVRAGDLIYVSGLPPFDPKTGGILIADIRAQTECVLNNVKIAVESAGGTMETVLKCTIFCTNVGYFNAINEVYAKFFPKDPPARTFCSVGSWPWEFDIEIECVALVKH